MLQVMHASIGLGELTAGRHVASERAFAEFRCGRPVMFAASDETVVAMPVDACNERKFEMFRRACGAEMHLAITRQRARALGLDVDEDVTIELRPEATLEHILHAEGSGLFAGQLRRRAGAAVKAAIDLAKLSARLPSLLIFMADRTDCPSDLLCVESSAVSELRQHLLDTLDRVACSTIPMEGLGAARLVVFEDAIGAPHVALILGEPDPSEPVLVRVHSRCLTGDVFGSQRCGCGDQLKLAARRMRGSGGIILYLDQEGRGLGLANKIRAYSLQDAGLDTIEANMMLGFESDERDYCVAGRLLQLLGFHRILLMTNNPDKLAGLESAGVEVSGRLPLQGPITANNRQYLMTMAERAGHRLSFISE
jgi:GTP cyclohydrolase II